MKEDPPFCDRERYDDEDDACSCLDLCWSKADVVLQLFHDLDDWKEDEIISDELIDEAVRCDDDDDDGGDGGDDEDGDRDRGTEGDEAEGERERRRVL